jgi:cell division inhibitor SulA
MAEEGQRCAGVSGGQTHLARLQHKKKKISVRRKALSTGKQRLVVTWDVMTCSEECSAPTFMVRDMKEEGHKVMRVSKLERHSTIYYQLRRITFQKTSFFNHVHH